MAHSVPAGKRADGARLGSRSGSVQTAAEVGVHERAQLRAVDPVCDPHHGQFGVVDLIAEKLESRAHMLLEGVDWRRVTAAPTTLSC